MNSHDKRRYLSREEETRLYNKFKRTGCPLARMELIDSQVHWCRRLANKFATRWSWDFDDAYQTILLRLIEIIDGHKFQPDKGRLTTLIAWASWRELIRERNRDRAIPLPATIVTKANKKAAEKAMRVTSISRHTAARLEVEGRPTTEPTPEEAIRERRIKVLCEQVVESMASGRDRAVVVRRMRGETLEEIGNDFGISKERVRQIEKRALRALRDQWGSVLEQVL